MLFGIDIDEKQPKVMRRRLGEAKNLSYIYDVNKGYLQRKIKKTK